MNSTFKKRFMMSDETKKILDKIHTLAPYKKRIHSVNDIQITQEYINILSSILRKYFKESDSIYIGAAWNISFENSSRMYDDTFKLMTTNNIHDENKYKAERALNIVYEYYEDEIDNDSIEIKGIDIIIQTPVYEYEQEKRDLIKHMMKDITTTRDIAEWITQYDEEKTIQNVNSWNIYKILPRLLFKKIYIFESGKLILILHDIRNAITHIDRTSNWLIWIST